MPLMDCQHDNIFIGIQISCLVLTKGLSTHGSQMNQNFQNPPRQYSKRQTRKDEIEKCLGEGLEPTYYFSIFN